MNRKEYMKQMHYNLRRLPREDYDKAIEYFEEYFDEAGPEQEQQAIEDLGIPESAAEQIIRDLAMENAAVPNKSVKRGMSAVWVGILAVFAAPIGLPIALAAVALIFSVFVVILSLLFSAVVTALALAVSAVPLLAGSVWLLFTSPINGLATLGVSLIELGVGIWIVKGCIALSKWCLNTATRLFGRLARRGKKYEKQK